MDLNDVMIFALEKELNMRATLINSIIACYYLKLHNAIASLLRSSIFVSYRTYMTLLGKILHSL